MSSFTVQLDESAFLDVVTGRAHRAIVDAVDDLKRLMIQSFGQLKTGRVYKFRGRAHTASAPGQAPAIRSGNLLRSLKESFPSPLVGELLIDTAYAAYLEEGTSRMAPRPFVAPAITSLKERFASGALGSFR